jgi:hypothetical protein
MSWIFGIIGKTPEPHIDRFKSIHQNCLMNHQTPNMYMACGGIPDTCFFEHNQRDNRGWIICGVGINDRYTVMSGQDWKIVMAVPPPPLRSRIVDIPASAADIILFLDGVAIKSNVLTTP